MPSPKDMVGIALAVSLTTPVFAQDSAEPGEPSTESTEFLPDVDRDPWYTPSAHNSHPWLTSLELGVTVVGGMVWYWVDRERQVADWDYPGWKKKLLFDKDIFIFDNNPFMVNYSWHTFAGAASQVLGRANGLGIYQSAGLGLGASILWEYGIESRELISLNDLLITNTTGIAAGEFFHRLAQYIQSRDGDAVAWQALRWSLGIAHSVHEQWDPSPHVIPKIWPRFRFSYELSSADVAREDRPNAEVRDDGLLHSFSFDGKLVALERYLAPGTRSGFFRQGNFTSFRLRLSVGDGSGTNVYGDTVLAGWRSESIPREGEGGLGLAYHVGTSIGYVYHREDLGIWDSRLGGLHAPGIATDGEVFGDSWRLTWQGRAHMDLMGVNSLSSQRWLDAHLNEETGEVGKSIIKNAGYYYAWGASVRAMVELELPVVTLGGSIFRGQYYSIEGYDRIRNQLAYEIRGHDAFLDAEAWLRASFYRELYAEVRLGEHRRRGQLEEFYADESLQHWTIGLGGSL